MQPEDLVLKGGSFNFISEVPVSATLVILALTN